MTAKYGAVPASSRSPPATGPRKNPGCRTSDSPKYAPFSSSDAIS
ncbi:MAG TPA: hypothetical protein VFV01_05205 [Spirillospora sp.]|nr:hypothetical protein [Spirillospora sp.]